MKQRFLSEGYLLTKDLNKGVFLFKDGEILDGYATEWNEDEGYRVVEHREYEAVSDFNRYDGEKFWIDMLNNVLIVMPENKQVMHLDRITEEQQRVIDTFGFELVKFE